MWYFVAVNSSTRGLTLRLSRLLMTPARIPKKIRLATMLCDHFVLCVVLIPLLIWSGLEREPWGLALLLAFYLNKDFFQGRSPAKRLLKLQVLNAHGQPANELRCVIRNMTFFLWPLEVLLILVGRHVRLGDRLAGTHVSWLPVSVPSEGHPARTVRLTRYSLYAPAATLAYLLLLQVVGNWVLGI
jgi:uncharacterized RDD family membrane protein YckC